MKKALKLSLAIFLAALAYVIFMPSIVAQKEAEFQNAGVEGDLFQDFQQFLP